MVHRSRSRLLLVIAVLALVAGAIVPATGAAAASIHTDTTPTRAPWVTRTWRTNGPTTGGNQVLIYGHHLAAVTTVRFAGVRATNLVVVSDDKIAVTAPAHNAGAVRLRVVSPGGSTPPSLTYRYVTPPTVAALSPSTGPISGGSTITVTGTGFSNPQTPVVWVKFGGIKGTNLVVVNDTTLTVTAPAHVAAGVRVRVVQYAASSVASSAARFTYSDAPTISSKSPPDGPPSGGTSVTIRGTGFTGATSVTFDGIPASFTVDNDTQITAVSPPHASGFVDVTITTPHGSVTDPANAYPFIYD